jgi:hypothetical protein
MMTFATRGRWHDGSNLRWAAIVIRDWREDTVTTLDWDQAYEARTPGWDIGRPQHAPTLYHPRTHVMILKRP